MSRSHIANMHSISSLPSVNQQDHELSTPRSVPSPAYGLDGGTCTPPPHRCSNDKERPRDSGVQAIGAFFSTPYDSDFESDSESISTTTNTGTNRQPVARARSARAVSVSVNKATAKGYKDVLEAKIKSQAGELDNWEDDENEQDELEPPRSPLKRNEERGRQSDESGRVRPLTVVEFPEPTLQPDQGHGRGYPNPTAPPSYTSNPNPPPATGYPRTPPRSTPTTAPLQPHRPNPRIDTSELTPPRTILLPPPSSPISPLLAAPPQPHFSPLSPPSSPFASPAGGHGPADSVSNGSISGFDIMAEKKALFREGQEELFTPFSTRRNRPGRVGVNGKQTKSAFLASGMDFWKRFSVHVKLDEQEKASKNENAWLSKAEERRGRIKKMIWVFVILLIILIASLVAYFVTRPSPAPTSVATSI
ncbi:hypothetical protein I302_100542 [Kwoniella bestiolae CBS 10118]|uniref:Uncharacterized protein n=1 Tax=Kwoniella bestiolae CBS 10118 TaxID=1296100 RepID=A0A1B9G5G2_9TREE|nr:hypothetical protein I302_03917 [Kwoniella bestiolae CBS 10118]OCF26238.1 hypothetical protein I302_03917 [Kwoniella bestiolae CBS 10118]